MGKTIHRAGVVVSGDYSGKSIYMRNDYSSVSYTHLTLPTKLEV